MNAPARRRNQYTPVVEREMDRPSMLRRLRDAFRFEDGEPHEWRDVAVFLTGSAWGAMLAVGLLLAVQP